MHQASTLPLTDMSGFTVSFRTYSLAQIGLNLITSLP